MKTALLVGASGLTGSLLMQQILNSDCYDRLLTFVRRDMGIQHPKLEQHIIDFDNMDTYRYLLKGDDLFCCLGSTIKRAGSQEEFHKIDYSYPVQFAKTACDNGVHHMLMVSAIGADSQSSVFYSRTKGKCEDAMRKLPFAQVSIFRPSFIAGNRQEFRPGERIGGALLSLFSFTLVGSWQKYRPIQASQIARSMLTAAQGIRKGVSVYESDVMQKM